jgi:hypothetical protein
MLEGRGLSMKRFRAFTGSPSAPDAPDRMLRTDESLIRSQHLVWERILERLDWLLKVYGKGNWGSTG